MLNNNSSTFVAPDANGPQHTFLNSPFASAPWSQHAVAAVVVAIFWLGVETVAGIMMDAILPVEKLKEKRERDTRTVSLIFSLFAPFMALLTVMEPDSPTARDPILGSSYLSSLTMTVSTGYFLWDVAVVARDNGGPAFMLHGILGVITSALSLAPFLQYYTCLFLLFTVSSTFMQFRYYLIIAKKTDTPAFHLVQYGFAVAFFTLRLVLGSVWSLSWWRDMVPYVRQASLAMQLLCSVFLLVNAAVMALNIFWFAQIVRSARKERAKTSTD